MRCPPEKMQEISYNSCLSSGVVEIPWLVSFQAN